MRCRLGAVDVEIALSSLDATLEIPARMVPAHGPLRALRAVAFWAAGVLAWVGVMVIQPTFWSPWEQDSLTRLSWLALGVAVGLPILAFVLIGLLRIVGRRARVSQALRAFSLVSWGWVLLLLVNEASSYLLTVPAHGVVSDLLQSVGVVLSVASLASVARRGPRRRFFLAWAVAIAFLLAGFGGAARLAMRQAGVPQVDYDVAVPVAGVTGPASSLDVYLQAVGRDFGEAERHAEEDHRRSESAGP
jgi:hypothetical protein